MSISDVSALTGIALVAAMFAALAIVPRVYQQTGTEDDPHDEAVTFQIASPSGAQLATKHYAPHQSSPYVLAIERQGPSNSLKREMDWNRLTHSGAGRNGGVVLNWDGDAHVTVAGPSDDPVPSGPDRLGDVQVSYGQYDRARLDDHGPRSSAVTLADVTYSVQRIAPNPQWSIAVTCILRAEGRDDRFHRLAGFDVITRGSGDHPDPGHPYSTPSTVLFAATYLPGAAERPTLTQGMVNSVAMAVQPRFGLLGPIQGDTETDDPKTIDRARPGNLVRHGVFYDTVFHHFETARIFDLLRLGRFEAVFDFGLGAQVVTYRFATPIPRDAIERFMACAATTNMYPYLTLDAPTRSRLNP